MTASLMFVIASAGMAAASPAAAPLAYQGGAAQVAHFDAAAAQSFGVGLQVVSGAKLTPKAAPAKSRGGAPKPVGGNGTPPTKIIQTRPNPPPKKATL